MSTTTFATIGGASDVQRYSPTMQALHWVVAVLMFSVLPLAWAMTSLPQNAPNRDLLFTLHKSVGLTILVLAAIRLVVRASRPIPAHQPGTPRWIAASAVGSHWLLYAVLLAMPISGYLYSAAGGYPVSYFGLFMLPMIPKNPAIQHTALSVHLLGQWAVYVLIALHLAATAWHVVVRRDGLLSREMPAQRVN